MKLFAETVKQLYSGKSSCELEATSLRKEKSINPARAFLRFLRAPARRERTPGVITCPFKENALSSRTQAPTSDGERGRGVYTLPRRHHELGKHAGGRNYSSRARMHLSVLRVIHKFNVRINPRADITKACRKDNGSRLKAPVPRCAARARDHRAGT